MALVKDRNGSWWYDCFRNNYGREVLAVQMSGASIIAHFLGTGLAHLALYFQFNVMYYFHFENDIYFYPLDLNGPWNST